mgnify:CR=1 FL=1
MISINDYYNTVNSKKSRVRSAFFENAFLLLFTPVSITPLIDTEDARFDLNASRPIAKGDLKWRDALLVAHRVNSNMFYGHVIVESNPATKQLQ